ncbi:MAG: ABC transporter substrate-binding protein [Clostridiaceae bacterium]|nr:ABC transporter substrate-binding protein [Clostridiaceae bacterium]
MKTDVGGITKGFVLFLVFSVLFTGCSINASIYGNEKDNEGSDIRKLPGYNIVWYHCNTPTPDAEAVFEEVNKYLKKKINATLEMKLVDFKDYDTKMKSVISSGEKFDICYTSAWINSYVHNAQGGAFIELDGLLDKYGKNTLNILPEVLMDAARLDGKLYALPVNKQLTHQWGIKFNRKYVSKYNFDISKVSKLEDLEPMLKIIKDNEPEVVPYLIYPYSCHAFALPLERVDEQVPSALYLDNRTNYRLVNTFETPEFKQYAALVHKWYKSGYILKDAASISNIDNYELSGNWFAGLISYNPSDAAEFSNTTGYSIETVPLYTPFITKKDITYYMHAVSSTSDNPERAVMLLDLLNTDRYLYNLMAYGIEGKHYEKISENVITPNGNTFYKMAPYSFGNKYLSYSLSNYSNTLNDENKRFDKAALISPLLKFTFDPAPVKDEILRISEITDELEGAIFVGAVDPEIFLPKIIGKYKAAGLDKVMEEQQSQLDKWLKNEQ